MWQLSASYQGFELRGTKNLYISAAALAGQEIHTQRSTTTFEHSNLETEKVYQRMV